MRQRPTCLSGSCTSQCSVERLQCYVGITQGKAIRKFDEALQSCTGDRSRRLQRQQSRQLLLFLPSSAKAKSDAPSF